MTRVIKFCIQTRFVDACKEIDIVYKEGYNMIDLINTLTRVVQNSAEFPNEKLRIHYLKEAALIKMRTLEGNNSQLQLHGFLGRLCQYANQM